METDVGSFTTSYDAFNGGTPVLLDLFQKHGITGTFYFTGDSAKKNPEMARRVRDAGHEIGCHTLFHETIGEPLFHISGDVPILPEEVPNRLAKATEWVREAIGVRPVSFRAPRLFGSTAMINALNDLGYVTDASYPMYFFRDRLTPYHPNRNDWTKEGDLRILELPNFADLSKTSGDPFGRDLDQWPLFRTRGADFVMRSVDGYIGYCRERKVEPFLCFYFHPWEFHPVPSGPYRFGEGSVSPDPFIVENCGPKAAREFDVLMERLKERGAEFFQARDLAAPGGEKRS